MPTRSPLPHHDDAELVDALVETTFLTTAVLSTAAATLDLSLTQVRVLGILQDREVRMSALADYVGLDKSTMSGLIDRAVARGLVIRRQDPADRRATLVTVSETGRELARSTRGAVGTALAGAIDNLTAGERKSLTRLLIRMHPVAESPLETHTTD